MEELKLTFVRAYGHGALSGGGSAPKFRSGAAGVPASACNVRGSRCSHSCLVQFQGDVSCDVPSSPGAGGSISWSRFCGPHVARGSVDRRGHSKAAPVGPMMSGI